MLVSQRMYEVRGQVLDDIVELVRTTSIVEPLLRSLGFVDIAPNRQTVAHFLRKQMTRQVILILTRLHESIKTGHHGETASIDALLHEAQDCGFLDQTQSSSFAAQRIDLMQQLEGKGVKFEEFRIFRNSQIAHSLHSLKKNPEDFMYWIAGDFAHRTYELCIDIEGALIKSGAPEITNLSAEFDVWRDLGEAFWK